MYRYVYISKDIAKLSECYPWQMDSTFNFFGLVFFPIFEFLPEVDILVYCFYDDVVDGDIVFTIGHYFSFVETHFEAYFIGFLI